MAAKRYPSDAPGRGLLTDPQWSAVMAHFHLTPRERDVVTALFDTSYIPAIAKALGISHNTVKTHIKSIHAKLGVDDRGDLILAIVRQAKVLQQSRPSPARGGHPGR